MRGPSAFNVTWLGGLGRVYTNEPRSNPNLGRIFTSSVLEVNSETGEGAFRDLSRGAMLYILWAGSMSQIFTRTHGTGPDTSTVQFRPSCKCVINSDTPSRTGALVRAGPDARRWITGQKKDTKEKEKKT